MAKILPFRPVSSSAISPKERARRRDRHRQQENAHLQRLMAFADRLDAMMLSAVASEKISHHEVAGLVAHRLGTFLGSIGEKKELWPICERVLKLQAVLDD